MQVFIILKDGTTLLHGHPKPAPLNVAVRVYKPLKASYLKEDYSDLTPSYSDEIVTCTCRGYCGEDTYMYEEI